MGPFDRLKRETWARIVIFYCSAAVARCMYVYSQAWIKLRQSRQRNHSPMYQFRKQETCSKSKLRRTEITFISDIALRLYVLLLSLIRAKVFCDYKVVFRLSCAGKLFMLLQKKLR